MNTQNNQLASVRNEISSLQNAHKQNLIGGNEYFSMLHQLYKKEKELARSLTNRELLLQIAEVSETQNPFEIALSIMLALKHEVINSDQYLLLCGELQMECKRNGISTANEIASIF